MSIDRVYISTCPADLRLARICVASIRFWHPNVPIELIRDFSQGTFCTREIEVGWDVKVSPLGDRKFGWGFGKLEPLFSGERERFLIVDADTVLTGPILNDLGCSDADFIVDDEMQPPHEVKRLYFDVEKLQEIDPTFRFGGKTFNSGQWVGTSGILTREDFSTVVTWASPPRLCYPNHFMPGDQGVLNYVLEKRANEGHLTLERRPIMLWAPRDLSELDLAKMTAGQDVRRIIHWAGAKAHRLGRMPRADILQHFERVYYSRIRFGGVLRRIRTATAGIGRVSERIGRRSRWAVLPFVHETFR